MDFILIIIVVTFATLANGIVFYLYYEKFQDSEAYVNIVDKIGKVWGWIYEKTHRQT